VYGENGGRAQSGTGRCAIVDANARMTGDVRDASVLGAGIPARE